MTTAVTSHATGQETDAKAPNGILRTQPVGGSRPPSAVAASPAPAFQESPPASGQRSASDPLIWAQLAYLADGPDSLLGLLVRAANAQTVFELLSDACRDQDGDRSESGGKSARSVERLLKASLAACDICPPKDLHRQLFSRLAHWRVRLRDLTGKSQDELHTVMTRGRYDLLTPDDVTWPAELDDLLLRAGSAPPLCLWVEGRAEALTASRARVAIVGSREADSYGQECAHQLAARLTAQGHCVLSGGAMGIDASAHWGALSVGFGLSGDQPTSPTVAIFAGGLRNTGPSRNLRLFDEILAHEGALVSELAPDTVPYSSRFLARNRLIAALADLVVVAQAAHRSGALNTAQWAAEMGRSVLAIPGAINSPMNAGCNRLLAEQKAAIMTDLSDTDAFLPAVSRHIARAGEADGPSPSEQPGAVTDRPPARSGIAGINGISGRTDAADVPEHILSLLTQQRAIARDEFFALLSPLLNPTATADEGTTTDRSPSDAEDRPASRQGHAGPSVSVINQALGALELAGRITVSADGTVRAAHRLDSLQARHAQVHTGQALR